MVNFVKVFALAGYTRESLVLVYNVVINFANHFSNFLQGGFFLVS